MKYLDLVFGFYYLCAAFRVFFKCTYSSITLLYWTTICHLGTTYVPWELHYIVFNPRHTKGLVLWDKRLTRSNFLSEKWKFWVCLVENEKFSPFFWTKTGPKRVIQVSILSKNTWPLGTHYCITHCLIAKYSCLQLKKVVKNLKLISTWYKLQKIFESRILN